MALLKRSRHLINAHVVKILKSEMYDILLTFTVKYVIVVLYLLFLNIVVIVKHIQ